MKPSPERSPPSGRPVRRAGPRWVDVAKGLCIILVVMMHSTLGTAALGEIAHPQALSFLERACDDPDPDVRKLIRWAIGRCRAEV